MFIRLWAQFFCVFLKYLCINKNIIIWHFERLNISKVNSSYRKTSAVSYYNTHLCPFIIKWYIVSGNKNWLLISCSTCCSIFWMNVVTINYTIFDVKSENIMKVECNEIIQLIHKINLLSSLDVFYSFNTSDCAVPLRRLCFKKQKTTTQKILLKFTFSTNRN